MYIELNGKTYKITENKTTWRVEQKQGSLTVAYSIPKDAAPDIEAVKAFMVEQGIA